jgi:O-acetyl-ADP-ribose deacetylase (regulator of RNase III)
METIESADPARNFKLILVGRKEIQCEEWNKLFVKYKNVLVIETYFEKLPEFDCMVSAANSFGLMDGGVDLAITNFFGHQTPDNAQKIVKEKFDGEQPVGTSFIFETGNDKHPYVAHTPTMRVPTSIRNTDYVYLATKAMLRAVYDHNLTNERKINIVACPALGALTGQVDPDEVARQMELAYRNFLFPLMDIDWGTAQQRQKEIKYGGYFKEPNIAVIKAVPPPAPKPLNKLAVVSAFVFGAVFATILSAVRRK